MDFDQTCEDMNWRIGVHFGFPPTEDERDFSGVDPKYFVTDTLIAFPVKSHKPRKGRPSERIKIRMINPSTWTHKRESPPKRKYKRPNTPDDNGDYSPPSPDRPGDEGFPIVMDIDDSDESEASETIEDVDEKEESEDGDDAESEESQDSEGSDEISDSSESESEDEDEDFYDSPPPGEDTNIKRKTKTEKQKKEKRVKPVPWHLVVPSKAWEKAVDKTRFNSVGKRFLKTNTELFRAVAFSPRGAKWVVAVGHAEAVAVWRLPAPPE